MTDDMKGNRAGELGEQANGGKAETNPTGLTPLL